MPVLVKYPLPSTGPEDVLVDQDGLLLSGTADGWIYEINPGTGAVTRLFNTGGIPLGLSLMPEGRLLVCDAKRGLLSIDRTNLKIDILCDRIEDEPLTFCNNADIAEDGRIYFSESSRRHGYHQSTRDILQHIPTGAFFCCSPDGNVERIAAELYFANGVCVAPDQSFVLIAETGAARIMKVMLSGADAGRISPFAENLAGLPDNLSLGSDGLVWVALVSPATEQLSKLQAAPYWLRKLISLLPASIRPSAPPFLRVQAYNFDGERIHDFEGDGAAFNMTTGVREHKGVVYLSSIAQEAIASFEVDPAV